MDERDLAGMKQAWNERARENARYYIATTNWESEEEFRVSGQRDVEHFFSGIEQLLTPDTEALDIGCGLGRMDEFIAPRIGRLTGIDVSGEMVRGATERLAHLDNVSFVEGSGTGLAPLADGSFDLVFSHVVFQHVPRSAFLAYLPEVHRVLRPGGDFVFQVPTALTDDPVADPPDDNTFDLRFYTEEDLRSCLDGASFTWGSLARFDIGADDLPVQYLRVHALRPA